MLELFASIPDSRSRSGRRHSLEEVLLIAVLAVICGADDWASVEDYGKLQEGFLQQFIEMPHGPPSDDTFRRVFMALDPVAFEEVFLLWTRELAGTMGLDIISIDGNKWYSMDRNIHMLNTLCRSFASVGAVMFFS